MLVIIEILIGLIKNKKKIIYIAIGVLTVCHNHPSGNINLSTQDKIITNRIKEIGQLLEIRLLDHIIITPSDAYVSMSDENMI
jgi:DNA repair protein RadC